MKPFSTSNYPLGQKTEQVRADVRARTKLLLKSGCPAVNMVVRKVGGRRVKPSKLRRQLCRSMANHASIRDRAMEQHLSQIRAEADSKREIERKTAAKTFKEFRKLEIDEKVDEIKNYVPRRRVQVPEQSTIKYLPIHPGNKIVTVREKDEEQGLTVPSPVLNDVVFVYTITKLWKIMNHPEVSLSSKIKKVCCKGQDSEILARVCGSKVLTNRIIWWVDKILVLNFAFKPKFEHKG